MKKLVALFIATVMVSASVACAADNNSAPADSEISSESPEVKEDPNVKSDGVMSYAEYLGAAIDDDVVIEGYVQSKQSLWGDRASLYLQDGDGGYFVFNADCTDDDYEKLEIGAKVKVTGKKSERKGEIMIAEGAALSVEDGRYIADVFDATELLGNDAELIKHQNKFVAFKGLTVVSKTDEYGNERAFFYGYSNEGEKASDSDLYFDATVGNKTYTFMVEYYLCNEETDTYNTVRNLKVGDVIDIEGFLYWYDTQNTQVTTVTVK